MSNVVVFEVSGLPQLKGHHDQVDLRPRTVRRWLSNLPIANLGTTSGSLYEALKSVNQRQLKTSERLAFLEALRPTLRCAIEGLRAHYSPKQFPVPSKSRRVSEFTLALLREMALGYDLIVQATAQGSPRVGKRQLTLAIERAIRCHSALLLECYYLYRPAPEGLWKHLHELYLTAQAQGLQDLPVANDELRYGRRSTVSQSYKQILLLAAAGPQRLRYQELEELYVALESWTTSATLTPLAAMAAAGSGFVVHLDRDLPPQPLLQPSIRTRQTHLLGYEQALASTKAPPAHQGLWSRLRRKAAAVPSAALQDRLIELFGTAPRRRFPRHSLTQPVHALIGLTHISQRLAQQQGVPLQTDSRSAVAVTVHAPDAHWEYDEKHGWKVTQGPAKKEAKKEIAAPAPDAESESATEQPQQDWRALDTSAGGYRLLLNAAQATLARLGEVIAIQEPDKPYQRSWQIGVIRWLRNIPSKGLELGVELIAVDPIPVLIKPEVTGGHEGKSVHALVLPQMGMLNQPMRILTPPLPYASGIPAAIIDAEGDQRILLTRELDTSGSFKSFEFEPVAQESEEKEPSEPENFPAVYAHL